MKILTKKIAHLPCEMHVACNVWSNAQGFRTPRAVQPILGSIHRSKFLSSRIMMTRLMAGSCQRTPFWGVGFRNASINESRAKKTSAAKNSMGKPRRNSFKTHLPLMHRIRAIGLLAILGLSLPLHAVAETSLPLAPLESISSPPVPLSSLPPTELGSSDFIPLKEAVTRPWWAGNRVQADGIALTQSLRQGRRTDQLFRHNTVRRVSRPSFLVKEKNTNPSLASLDALLRARIPAPVNRTYEWHLYKTHWSLEDEIGYEAFVTLIGRSSCYSLDDCLRDPANPYRDLEDDTIYLGDCADMVYFLRGYYAWKNGLPFSYQHRVKTASGQREDLRYSKRGNIVVGRRNITNTATHTVNAQKFLQRIGGEVSTAMFRIHPVSGTQNTFDDFYPVKIERASLRPGSIAYDVFGHVGLVYETLDDGNVKIVASHPDFRVTRSRYGSNFMRTGPEFGGGLKAWRPIRLVGARKTSQGRYIGGHIEGAPNSTIADFSMEQYEGSIPHPSGDWQLGEFQHQGRTLGFYDFVRKRLAAPGYAFDPLVEMRDTLEHICNDLVDRRSAIGLATRSKFYLKPHPKKLPPNIYGTYGEWELYSTPSRDARLKKSYVDLMAYTKDQIARHRRGAEDIAYQGDNLARDMLGVYDDFKNECKIRYRRSDDTFVILNFAHINDRVFEMSFDPYHCPELRWGASGLEAATCPASSDKYAWYEAQRYLRYQVERTYDVRMDFTLAQLRPPDEADAINGGLGIIAPPDIDIRALLHRHAHSPEPKVLANRQISPVDGPVIIEYFDNTRAPFLGHSRSAYKALGDRPVPGHRPEPLISRLPAPPRFITYHPLSELPVFQNHAQ